MSGNVSSLGGEYPCVQFGKRNDNLRLNGEEEYEVGTELAGMDNQRS